MARDKVVLAYSGGLDTSVAVKWINETYNMDVIAYTCDLGQGQDIEAIRQKALQDRRDRSGRRGCAQPVRRLLRLPVAGGRRPLRGEISAGDGPGPSLDRAAHGPRRAGAWRRGRRSRLHRQGERPGPVRRHVPDARPRPEDHRAGPRMEVDADPGARVRRQARHRGRGDQEVDLQHRPEPLGPLDRGRHPRRSLGRAAARDLPVDRRPPAGPRRARGGRDHVRPRQAGGPRRPRARRRRADRRAQPARRQARRRAGSTISRTAWSASSRARSTRPPPPWCSTRPIARSSS